MAILSGRLNTEVIAIVYQNQSSKLAIRIMKGNKWCKKEHIEEGQLSSYGQIYNNQLRWEWKYEYVDSTRIGLFETYYNDGKDYLKREYRTFKGNKLITITDTSNTITTQTKLYYNDIGLINKIENYESNSMQLGLKLKSYYDIKTKYKMSMTKILIDLVNKIIFND